MVILFDLLRQTDSIYALKTENETIELSSDLCPLLARGSEKQVYKFGDTGLCFYLPTSTTFEKWDKYIVNEKNKLDHILSIGLRALKLKNANLTIKSNTGENYSINILVTETFNSLVKQSNLVICDTHPGLRFDDTFNIFGNIEHKFFNFELLCKNFEDSSYVIKVIEKFVIDVALKLAFSLPRHDGDGTHFCFELPFPEEIDRPAIVRYMFWDIKEIVTPIPRPCINLKYRKKLIILETALEVASAIAYTSLDKCDQDCRDMLINRITSALNENDALLNQAILLAEKKVTNHFTDVILPIVLPQLIENINKNDQFLQVFNDSLDADLAIQLKPDLALDLARIIKLAAYTHNIELMKYFFKLQRFPKIMTIRASICFSSEESA